MSIVGRRSARAFEKNVAGILAATTLRARSLVTVPRFALGTRLSLPAPSLW